jgi:hypothetical protein
LDDSNHAITFDPRYARELPPAMEAYVLLRAEEAPDICRVISADSDLERRDMPLAELRTWPHYAPSVPQYSVFVRQKDRMYMATFEMKERC